MGPRGRASEYVLTMDADTVLLPDTVAGMARELVDNPMLGGVCARYWAKDGHGLLWRLQRLEYARYDDMRELRGLEGQRRERRRGDVPTGGTGHRRRAPRSVRAVGQRSR